MKKLLIFVTIFITCPIMVSCKSENYNVFFYDLLSEQSYEIGYTSEKLDIIKYTDFDFSILPEGILVGFIGIESNSYIGVCPFSNVRFSSKQLQLSDFLYTENTFLSEINTDLSIKWYSKISDDNVTFVEDEEVYLDVNIGYYSLGVQSFGIGAYRFGVYDMLGYELEDIYIYNVNTGFTITLTEPSTLLSKFTFSKITITNTEENVKIFTPKAYVGGVIKDVLSSNGKITYTFGNQSIELYTRPIVKRS